MPHTHTITTFTRTTATLLACLAGSANAFAPVNWDGEAGDLLWFSDDNWNPNGVPGEMDTVTVDSGGPVTAASMPIEVISVEALSGLEIISSSLKVATDSMITDFYLGGCCTTPLDSGGGTITYLGNHQFNASPAFIGKHVINGNALFKSTQLIVRPLSELTINADITMMGSGARLDTGATASITGTLTLNNATLSSPVDNPDATWYFDGGNLAYSGTADAVITDKVFVTGGTVSADTKQLEFSNDFVFQDAQVVVSNAGRIIFDASPNGPGGEELGVNTFSGDGRIELQGDVVNLGDTVSTSSVTGDGFWIRETLLIDAELRNTGIMQFRGGTVDGLGKLIAQSGTLSAVQGADIFIETQVQSGATFNIDAAINLTKDIRIDPGGVAKLNAGITAPETVPPSDPRVLVFGQLNLPNSTQAAPALQDVQLALREGGEINIDDRTLNMRGESDLEGGTITLTDTPISGYPRLLFSGDDNDLHAIGEGVFIRNDASRAEVNIGNGVGTQPNLTVNGDAFFRIMGDQSLVRFRVPSIMSDRNDSQIVNEGIMHLERTLTTSVTFLNRGDLRIAGQLTLDTGMGTIPGIINDVGGTLTQVNTIIAEPVAGILNNGEWIIPASYQIIPVINSLGLEVFNNTGTLRATGGSSSIDLEFDNQGTVIADGATISFTNATKIGTFGGRYLSGNWKTINNGKILYPENPPTVFRGPGTTIEADSDNMPAMENIEEVCDEAACIASLWLIAKGRILFNGHSTLEVLNGGLFHAQGELDVQGDSAITVNPGATVESQTAITIGSNDIKLPSVTDDITGIVQLTLGDTTPPSIIAPNINIHANLTPIRDDIGVMNTSGALTIHPTGTLRINARADGLSSAINHTGDLEITGNISITPLKAYEPQVGDSFTIATVSGNIGELPSFAVDASGSGTAYTITTVGSDIVVTVSTACPADLNADGSLNFFDVSVFLSTMPDYNNDGGFNFFDVSAFLTDFTTGCP